MLMATLIRNEIIKTFSRAKTWVVLVLLIAFCGIITYAEHSNYKNSLKYDSPSYQIKMLKSQIKDNEEVIKSTKEDKEMTDAEKSMQIKGYEDEIKLNKEEIKKQEKLQKDLDSGKKIDYISELKESLKNVNSQLKEQSQKSDLDTDYINHLKLQKMEMEYKINHNINEPENSAKFNAYTVLTSIMNNVGILLLPIGIMIFFSDMVSGEYTPATLKFLLVQPVSRRKVLISKIITSVIVSVALILLIEAAFFLAVGAFTGFEGANSPVITGLKYAKEITKDGGVNFNLVDNVGSVSSTSSFLINALGLQVLFITATTIFTLMISTIFKSSMITMAISIVLTVATYIVTMLSSQIKAISHMIFLTFSDTASILTGNIVYQYGNVHLTTYTFVITMIVTSIISYIISDLVFTKRDILI